MKQALAKLIAGAGTKLAGFPGWLLSIVLDVALGRLLEWVKERQRQEKIKAENKAAIEKAKSEGDQRDIEKQLGNTNAGDLSGTPGAIVVDDLPGLHHEKPD